MGLWDWLTGRVTPDRFAAMMIDAMRQAGLAQPVEYVEDDFSLRVGKRRKIPLETAYEEYIEAPSSVRHHVVEHYAFGVFVRAQDLTPGSFKEAAPNLRPIVRGRMYPEYMRMQAEIDDDPWIDPPTRVIGEHFAEMLAYDMPERVLYLPSARLEDWGESVERAFEGTPGRIYVGAWDDGYGASRVTTPEMILKLELSGRPVVALPNPETLIVAASEDDEALLQMGRMISQAESEAGFESGIVLTLDDERWRPFLPPEGGEAFELLYRQRVASYWRDYDEQKRLMDALNRKRGVDTEVAPFLAHHDRMTHELNTMTIWLKNGDTLLPKSQIVSFATGDPKNPTMLGAARWDRVMAAASNLMEPTDHYPERWRVSGFPATEQLDAMGLAAPPEG